MRFPSHLARQWGGAASKFMLLTLLTLAASGLRAHAESHAVPNREVRIAAASDGAAGLLREIDDPSSGTRWLLVRDQSNPGGPGRLELVTPESNPEALGTRARVPLVAQIRPVPVIRAGDKLVVEEHSATTDAYLEGVALGPAVRGSALNVRLSIGGRMVRAVAVAPGRAALQGVRR
jgi:hypothetical protein